MNPTPPSPVHPTTIHVYKLEVTCLSRNIARHFSPCDPGGSNHPEPGLASAPARSAHAGGPEGSALTRSLRAGCIGLANYDSDTGEFLCFFPSLLILKCEHADLTTGDVSHLLPAGIGGVAVAGLEWPGM